MSKAASTNPTGPTLAGIRPDHLQVRSQRIILEALDVKVDIGFHEFEVGTPQRVLVTIEIWLEDNAPPLDDDPMLAWNYDFVRREVDRIAGSRRFNLQETLAHAVLERIADLRGVRAVRVRTSKPDIYLDALGVGIEIASFPGAWPGL